MNLGSAHIKQKLQQQRIYNGNEAENSEWAFSSLSGAEVWPSAAYISANSLIIHTRMYD